MALEAIFDDGDACRPDVLYLTGKTCTGKTTFATRLQNELDYKIIELDQVVNDAVIENLGLADRGAAFVSVYRTGLPPEWTELFIAETRRRIAEYLRAGKKVVVDGAVANVETVARIFGDCHNAKFIYFHPTENSQAYSRNLTSRFMNTTASFENGLPNKFWRYVDQADFAQFCRDKTLTPILKAAIASYAAQSSAESKLRLENLRVRFPRTEVIEV